MSTITITLTAVTEPIKATTVDASSPTSISAYVASQEAHDADISNTFVPQLNAIIGQTNTVIGELNTIASGVSTNAGIATTKAQLASDYAQKVNATVETGTYSSKEHAIGDLTTSGGSAKAWATDTASPDGTTSKSAKTYAEEAAAAVATLPAGIINDAQTTDTNAWSAAKIGAQIAIVNNEINTKAVAMAIALS